MIESCDLRTGVFFAAAGLLALSGWIWQDCALRSSKAAPAWGLGAIATFGLMAVPYLLWSRGHSRMFLRAIILWILWMAFSAGGGTALALASRHSRQGNPFASLSPPAASTKAVSPEWKNIHWGAFGEVFPGAPPSPAPSPKSQQQSQPSPWLSRPGM